MLIILKTPTVGKLLSRFRSVERLDSWVVSGLSQRSNRLAKWPVLLWPTNLGGIRVVAITQQIDLSGAVGRMVASVITSTQAFPTPEEEAKPAAVKLLRQQSLSDAMRRQLEKARASAKIEYKPGFAPTKQPAGGTPPPLPANSAPPAKRSAT